jgi:D-Tyr-tRNAtyr deacylase
MTSDDQASDLRVSNWTLATRTAPGQRYAFQTAEASMTPPRVARDIMIRFSRSF